MFHFLDDSEEENVVDQEEPRRTRYIIRSQRRRDRLVLNLDAALNADNYDKLPPVTNGTRHVMKMTGDRARGIAPKTITWTTQPRPPRRIGPENIMSKPRKLSEEAAAASSPLELWELYWTDEMLDIIVTHTNEKIAEELLEKDLTEEQLQKSPYLRLVDKVKNCFNFSWC